MEENITEGIKEEPKQEKEDNKITTIKLTMRTKRLLDELKDINHKPYTYDDIVYAILKKIKNERK